MAQAFDARIAAHPSYEIVAPTRLSLVTFRHVGGDEENERIRDEINASERAYVTHTSLNGQMVLCVAIGAVRTEQRHVDDLVELVESLG